MTPKRIIYGLIDPRTEECRYIGRSSSGTTRPLHHTTPCWLEKDRSHKASWIRQLLALGLRPRIVVLEDVGDGDLNEREKAWVYWARQWGWPLTNHTDGGGGMSGYKFSEEHKAKIAAANLGRKMTPEQRAKLSVVAKARPVSQEKMEKMRAAWTGSKHSEEAKARISAAEKATKERNRATSAVLPSLVQ